MPKLDRFPLTRIVSTPALLDGIQTSTTAIVMRTAPDELFWLGSPAAPVINDPHAIIEHDTSFVGTWLSTQAATAWVSANCEWQLPTTRPVFAQGEVAGLPVKLWIEPRRMLVLVQQPFAADLGERLQ